MMDVGQPPQWSDEEARGILQQSLMDVVFDEASPASPEDQERIQHLAASHPQLFTQDYQFELGWDLVEKPLHILCFVNSQVSEETFNAVISAGPDVLKLPSNSMSRGCLPIHRAEQLEIVKALYDARPETVSMKNHRGQTPLHHCCKQMADLPSLFPPARLVHHLHLTVSMRSKGSFLLQVCPSSALIPDKMGRLPLHTLLYGLPAAVNSDLQQLTLEVLRTVPSAAAVSTPDMPLSLALEGRGHVHLHDIHETIVAELLEYNPQAADDPRIVEKAFQRKNLWQVRLQVLSYHLSRRCGNNNDDDSPPQDELYTKTYPLHAILRYHHFDGLRILSNECIQHFGDRMNHVDSLGCLPLHLALRLQKVDRDDMFPGILEMIQAEPRAALIRDSNTGLLPFMAAACMGIGDDDIADSAGVDEACWIETIYRTLRILDVSEVMNRCLEHHRR